jgi:hypothetical protein
MKKLFFLLAVFVSLLSRVDGQSIALNKENLVASQVYMTPMKMDGQNVIRVIMDSSIKLFDQPTFVKLKDMNFTDGTIEVRVLSKFLPNSPDWARGFIGVVFRVSGDDQNFESFYLRPSNGRADDQIRRNHSVQYFSYPGFAFDRMRKDFPEKYESYADMEMNKWIKMKIVVKGQKAQLFLDDNPQPCLVVNDLKHGATGAGSIGLWVGNFTEGYFSDLKITMP